jgi:iron complex outermembrane receptor protein
MKLEDRINLEVTSVSKKTENLARRRRDFRYHPRRHPPFRVRNISEPLRMVPGLDVGQINANTSAIFARGFNSQFANKLVVLIAMADRSIHRCLVASTWER